MRSRLAIVLAASLFAGCASGTAETGAEAAADSATTHSVIVPTVDISTPDRALKSYWAVQDADRVYSVALRERLREDPGWKKLAEAEEQTIEADALATYRKWREVGKPEQFHREILNVDQQTESRAVIDTRQRNISPIPDGATPDEIDVRWRRDGWKMRYILEKYGDGWKVVQAQEYSEYGKTWDNKFDPSPSVPALVRP